MNPNIESKSIARKYAAKELEGSLETKPHGFSKKIATLRDSQGNKLGSTPAILLRYIAYRNRKPTEQRSGLNWTRINVDYIAKAYCYLSRSAIDEAVKRLEKFKLCKIDAFNKRGYDRTRWYHVPFKYAEAAEDNLIYFDPTTAVSFGVPGAVVLRNWQYWISQCEEQGKKKEVLMSPQKLAELLPFDRSTIKRALEVLVEAGVIAKLSKTKPIYGPGSNSGNGSETLLISAEPDRIGSNPDEIGSNPDNNMYCKRIKKELEKNSKKHPDGCEYVASAVAEADGDSGSSSIISADGQKQCIAHEYPFSVLDSLSEIHEFNRMINESFPCEPNLISKFSTKALEISSKFLAKYSIHEIQDLVELDNGDELVSQLLPAFHEHLLDFPLILKSTLLLERIFYGSLECIAGSILMNTESLKTYTHGIAFLQSTTYFLNLKIFRRLEEERLRLVEEEFAERRIRFQSRDRDKEDLVGITAAEKMRAFKNGLHERNKVGWIFSYDQTLRTEIISWTKPSLEKVKNLFELNPNLTARDLLTVMDKCMYLYAQQEPPKEFRKGIKWHARMGHRLSVFASYLETILRQFDEALQFPITAQDWSKNGWLSPCPITVFLTDEKKGDDIEE